jgi:hypothetical protein
VGLLEALIAASPPAPAQAHGNALDAAAMMKAQDAIPIAPPERAPEVHAPAVHVLESGVTAGVRSLQAVAPEEVERPRRVPLVTLAGRFELKRDACGAVLTKGDLAPLLPRAHGLQTELWVLHQPHDRAPKKHLKRLECAYDLAARATRILKRLRTTTHGPLAHEVGSRAMHELMHAVAAVRPGEDGRYWFDPDQSLLHSRIREYATHAQVFLPYLATKPRDAPPLNVAELTSQVFALENIIKALKAIESDHKSAAYHAKQLLAAPEDLYNQLTLLEDFVTLLYNQGVAPNNPLLQRTLRPLRKLDINWVNSPNTHAALIVSATRHSPRTPPAQLETKPDTMPRPYGEEVARVGELLAGRTLLIVGGDARSDALEKLRAAFTCDVEWQGGTGPQGEDDGFTAALERPAIGAAIVLSGLMSYLAAESVKNTTARLKTPVAYVPRAYSPNRMAHELLKQAGDALEARHANAPKEPRKPKPPRPPNIIKERAATPPAPRFTAAPRKRSRE